MRRIPTPSAEEVPLDFEGQSVCARIGETIAAALTAADIKDLRVTASGETRGIFCGMGVCHECLVDVDGQPNVRACMTKVTAPHRIRRQPALASLSAQIGSNEIMEVGGLTVETPDIVVIGGGAGGLTAAAVSAEAGANVVLIDERPQLGGQFYKQPASFFGKDLSDAQYRDGASLIERVRRANVTIIEGTVWGAFAPLQLAVATAQLHRTIQPARLIVASGAYERVPPIKGWTLAGVMTSGAAQSLLRSYRVTPGRRILIAGNGPLNFQVARELTKAGAEIVAVAELAPRPHLRQLGALYTMLSAAPRLVRDGLTYIADLRRTGVPLLYAHRLASITPTVNGLKARLERCDNETLSAGPEFVSDCVLLGYGFLPANEVLRALGAEQTFDSAKGHLVTVRDDNCQTNVPGLYGVGDCCGLSGAQAAVEEGLIAATAAVRSLGRPLARPLDREEASSRKRLLRSLRFQRGLWSLFAPAGAPAPPSVDTLICRCEQVSRQQIEAVLANGSPPIGEVKRRTRAGMGRCQGRYCALTIATMIAERTHRPLEEAAFFAPRPPIKPVRISRLADPKQEP
jgi:thioredoxin reductase